MKKYIITFLICTSSLMAVQDSDWASTWNLTGNLNTINYIKGNPLIRQCKFTPKSTDFLVKEIVILGYRDGDFIVSIDIKNEIPDLTKVFQEKKLGSFSNDFSESNYMSRNNTEEFLNFFELHGLISNPLTQKITTLITENTL